MNPTRETFFERLRRNERPVVVDVWAPWCGPCRMLEPALERLAEEYAGRVDLWKINADEEPDLVRALGVHGIPTLIVYRGEREIARRIGAQSQSALTALFEAALSGRAPAPTGPAPMDRVLRIAAGFVFLAIAWTKASPALLVIGILFLLTGVYDRIPLWHAFVERGKGGKEKGEEA